MHTFNTPKSTEDRLWKVMLAAISGIAVALGKIPVRAIKRIWRGRVMLKEENRELQRIVLLLRPPKSTEERWWEVMLAAISGIAVAVGKIPVKAVKWWWRGKGLKEVNRELLKKVIRLGKDMYFIVNAKFSHMSTCRDGKQSDKGGDEEGEGGI